MAGVAVGVEHLGADRVPELDQLVVGVAGQDPVTAVGIADAPERESAILVTEYLDFSIQYRRLLMRFPLGPGPYRDRLLDAMAWLLVDLHRAGVYWGDCSLANTLFRRDGDKIQAFLVDAETSSIYPALSDGQRGYTPFGTENAKGQAQADLKEFWHTGRALPPDSPYRDTMKDTPAVSEVEPSIPRK